MNPKDLRKLVERARRGVPDEDGAPPFGFANRVAARWAREPRGQSADGLLVWERLARWGVAGAMAACIVMAVVNRVHPPAPAPPTALEVFAGLVDDEDSF